MRVRLMGSGAAEGWPGVWCDCNACNRAREAGGKNIRTRSGALVDDDIKIDLCPDTYAQAMRDGINLSKVRHLLITHSHGDHFYVNELGMTWSPFSHTKSPLHIWADRWAIEDIRQKFPNWPRPETLHVLEAYQPARFDDMEVVPIRAAHYPERGGFNYIIRRGGKSMLYGLDSGWYPEESWVAHQGTTFDLVVMDCTHGPLPGGEHHGGIDTVVAIRQRMLKEGTATERTVFVANHFSHNGGLLHEELVERLNPHGILVGYDGMEIEV